MTFPGLYPTAPRRSFAGSGSTAIFAPAWSQPKGTDVSREVLLNDRALQVLEKARPTTAARSDDVFAPKGSGDRSELHIRSETGAKRHWLKGLRQAKIQYRQMHNIRHT